MTTLFNRADIRNVSAFFVPVAAGRAQFRDIAAEENPLREQGQKKVYKDKKGGLKKSVFSRVKFCLYYAKPRSEGASINFSNALMTRDGASGLSCN